MFYSSDEPTVMNHPAQDSIFQLIVLDSVCSSWLSVITLMSLVSKCGELFKTIKNEFTAPNGTYTQFVLAGNLWIRQYLKDNLLLDFHQLYCLCNKVLKHLSLLSESSGEMCTRQVLGTWICILIIVNTIICKAYKLLHIIHLNIETYNRKSLSHCCKKSY